MRRASPTSELRPTTRAEKSSTILRRGTVSIHPDEPAEASDPRVIVEEVEEREGVNSKWLRNEAEVVGMDGFVDSGLLNEKGHLLVFYEIGRYLETRLRRQVAYHTEKPFFATILPTTSNLGGTHPSCHPTPHPEAPSHCP